MKSLPVLIYINMPIPLRIAKRPWGTWAATFSHRCFGSGLYQAVLPSAGQGWWHKHFTTIFKYDSFTKNLSREDAHANILWRLWLSVKKPVVLTPKMLNIFCIIFFFSQQNRSKLLQKEKHLFPWRREVNIYMSKTLETKLHKTNYMGSRCSRFKTEPMTETMSILNH